MKNSKELLKKATLLVIPGGSTPDHNWNDLVRLMETYGILEQAHKAFLDQELTLQEYLDILATGQVNIDSYMKTVEANLETMGVM